MTNGPEKVQQKLTPEQEAKKLQENVQKNFDLMNKNLHENDSLMADNEKIHAKLKRIMLPTQTESKETAKKSLEFEEKTFKIDSKGWKLETRKVYGKETPANVKVNKTGDVLEYTDGPAKGEQIFITYDAFIREVCKAKGCTQEVVEKKYLMTIEEFKEKMKDKPGDSPEYKTFFNEQVNGHLAGFWDPNDRPLDDLGKRSYVWLVGGRVASFNQHRWLWSYNNLSTFGFSGRLLKN